jgi:peptide-methionine (S)-S-oxide reductase
MTIEIATFGGGCFWCTEAVFQGIRGVKLVESGYAGGKLVNPSYEQVCEGESGHAEVIRLTYDSDVVSYKELLEIFFTIHDPTTLNRQGSDTGTQYRSVVFYHSPQQQAIAVQVMDDAKSLWRAPLVTELSPAPAFYVAEDYHQNYFRNHSQQRYCMLVIEPKVQKARKFFLNKMAVCTPG